MRKAIGGVKGKRCWYAACDYTACSLLACSSQEKIWFRLKMFWIWNMMSMRREIASLHWLKPILRTRFALSDVPLLHWEADATGTVRFEFEVLNVQSDFLAVSNPGSTSATKYFYRSHFGTGRLPGCTVLTRSAGTLFAMHWSAGAECPEPNGLVDMDIACLRFFRTCECLPGASSTLQRLVRSLQADSFSICVPTASRGPTPPRQNYMTTILTCIFAYIQRCLHPYIYTYFHKFVLTYLHKYIHTHAYIFTYTFTYIHTFIFTYVHTYIRTYIHAFIHACIHAYIHTYVHTYIHAFIHACIHAYIHTCLHAYTHTPTHTHVHTYIHTYIHTQPYTHRHIHTHTDTYRHIHTNTDTYRHIHTHTYAHIHNHTPTYACMHAYVLTDWLADWLTDIQIHRHTFIGPTGRQMGGETEKQKQTNALKRIYLRT